PPASNPVPFVNRHGSQPTPKGSFPVIFKLRHLLYEMRENLLHEIVGFAGCKTGSFRPVMQQRRVKSNESRPCLVIRRLAQTLKKADGGRVHRADSIVEVASKERSR